MQLLHWLHQIIARTGIAPTSRRNLSRVAGRTARRRTVVRSQVGSLGWGHSVIDVEQLEDRTLLAVTDVIGHMTAAQFTPLIGNQTGYKNWGNEPFIAVNPTDPNKMVITGFGYGTSSTGNGMSVWYSTDGGANWKMTFPFESPANGVSIPADQTVAYDDNGNLHITVLAVSSGNLNIYHGVTSTPDVDLSATWTSSFVNSFGTNGVDQPYMALDNGHVYIAYDDFTSSGFVRVARSDDNGVTFPASADLPITMGNAGRPSNSFTNPGVRITTDDAGNAYSIVGMGTGSPSQGVQTVTWRLNTYHVGTSGNAWDHTNDTASPGGILIDTGTSHQIDGTGATWFGKINELRGNTTAIAVSPAGDHIYVVYGKQDPTGLDRLYIQEYHPSGNTLVSASAPIAFSVPGQRAVLPTVAVTDNGTVFVQYQSYVGPGGDPLAAGGTFQVHLASSTDFAQTFFDRLEYSYLKPGNPGDPGFSSNRLLGDYQFLQAEGDTVYGVFPATGNINVGPINTTGLISPFFLKESGANLINVTATPTTVLESGLTNIVYTFTRTGAIDAPLNANITIAGTALQGLDYAISGVTLGTGGKATVNFAAGIDTVIVTVDPTDDFTFESSENVLVTLVTGPGYTVGTNNTIDATIMDDDGLPLSVIPLNDGIESTVSTNGRIRFSQPVITAVDTVITYTVVATATAGIDYTALPGTVTIPAGQTFVDVDINVLNDTTLENTETVYVSLELVSGDPSLTIPPSNFTFVGSFDASTWTFSDNAGGSVNLTSAPASITLTSGNSNTFGDTDFSHPMFFDGLVQFTWFYDTIDGAQFDYPEIVINGVAQIVPGFNTAGADNQVGNSEVHVRAGDTFAFRMHTTDGIAGSANTRFTNFVVAPRAAVYIIDNETVSISKITDGVEAGVPTNARFRITQTALSPSATIVNYTITGSATPGPGNDYNTLSGTATIAAGQFSTDVVVSVLNDAIVENTETVILTLSGFGAHDARLTLDSNAANRTATANITDSDTATVSISKILDGAETNTPTNGQFRVTQTAISSTPTVINYSIGGSATPGAGFDYTALTGSVTIPAGLTNANIDITVLNDAIVEGLENVTLTLTGFGAHDSDITLNVAPATLTATANITDDDTATISIAKLVDGIEAVVPTNGAFRITTSKASATDTVVNYSVGGTATPGAAKDYVPLTGTVTIPAGQTFVDLAVNVLDDNIIEGQETVIVGLTSLGAHDPKITLNGTPANITATVDIADAETAIVSIIKTADGVESETPTNGQFQVTQTAISPSDTVIAYIVTGTAQPGAGNDYVTLSGTVTIPAGQTTATIDVTVLNDAFIEPAETVIVTLTGITTGNPAVSLNLTPANLTATVSITDVESVSIAAILDGAEGTSPTNGRFRVTQSATSPTDTVINYSIGGTALPGAGKDYLPLFGTVIIPAGQLTADIDVTVLNDLELEGLETVTVTLTGLGAHDPAIILDPLPAKLVATVNIIDDDVPLITSAASASFPENTPISTVLVDVNVDPANVVGLTVTYSLTGPDAGAFDIDSSTGVITFKAVPDYENPADQDLDNIYHVTVNASADTVPPQVATQALTITVTPVNEFAPQINSSATAIIPENTATVVLDVNATDLDKPTASLVYTLSGPDSGLLSINPATGEITFNNPPDFESPVDQDLDNTYNVTVTVSDNDAPALSNQQNLTITVTAVNDNAPVMTSPSTVNVPENTPFTNVILDVNATDADSPAQSLSYSLSGPDVAKFSFDTVTGEIRFATSPDYENPADAGADNIYDVTVTITDNGSPTQSTSRPLVINVTPVNDNLPIASSPTTASVPENTQTTTVVLDVNATDADQPAQTLNYALTGPDAGAFNINSTTGQITFAVSPNFEAPTDSGSNNIYNVTVTITDSGNPALSISQLLAITVTNVNEQPSDINLSSSSIAENLPANSTVGAFITTDQDFGQTFTYALVSGPGSVDNNKFTITAGNLVATSSFDFEAKPSYSIRVRTTDNGGLSIEKNLIISVVDVNDTPTDIGLTGNSVVENQPVGTLIGQLSTTDQDAGDTAATFTYSLPLGLSGGEDNASFAIVGGQLVTATSFNFEAKSVYSVRVRSTDQGGLSVDKVFTVNVQNINEQPTNISLSKSTVDENLPGGAIVGNLITADQDFAESFTYQLVSGPGSDDNSRFVIVNGQIQTQQSFNFEAQNSYTIRVKTTDVGGLSFEKVLTIGITNVNEPPVSFSLSSNTIAENLPASTAVGSFSTIDIDNNDTFTYSLVLGSGSADNDKFTIVGDQLQTATGFDFEAGSTYSIRVRSKDAGGLFVISVFTVNVTNVNEAPVDISVSPSTITENQPVGTTVGNLVTNDPDTGDTFNYALVSGAGSTNNGSFTIVNGQLRAATVLDFEAQPTYSVRLRSTDSGGLSVEKAVTIAVTNANETPTDIGLSSSSIAENRAIGSLVGNFNTTDPDVGDSFTYTLVSGAGSVNNGSFDIVAGQLVTAASFDFETKSSYSIRVRSTDAGGLSTEKSVTISVTNVNEAPTDITATPASVAENLPAASLVGSLTTTDQDAGDTFTYSLVLGAGGVDNSSFNIVGSQIFTSASFDFETKSSYSIRVRSTDAGNLTTERIIPITITNVNEAPTELFLSNTTINENQPASSDIGTFGSTDPDAAEAFTYSLVSGSGATGNAAFVIVGDRLRAVSPLNFEAQDTYSIRVRTIDAGGLSLDDVFTIHVADVEDPPVVNLTAGPSTVKNGKGGPIDPTASVTDEDSTDFNGNRIIVTITPETIQSPDRLRLIPSGKGTTRLKASHGQLKLGKTVIGTATGGRDGAPLEIRFTSSTDAALAQRLVNHLGLKTRASNGDTRQIAIQMFDAEGNNNPPVVKDVVIGG